MLSEKIYSLRAKSGITQEDLANKLDVTRQSVQKWESGASAPTMDKIMRLAKIFGVSVDYLCGETSQATPTSRIDRDYAPNHLKWESYAENMDIEYRQCVDEGKDVAAYRDLFSAVAKMPASGYKDKVGETLFFLVDSLPTRADYEYCEPNDLNAIRMYRKEKAEPVKMPELSEAELLDKCTGGWYGRICGCLLGKPVEMSRMPDLEKILKRTNNYPISRYVDKEDVEKIDTSDITHDIVGLSYRSDYGMMPPDDDTNYIVIGYEVLRRHGRDFTSEGVADVWLNTQTKFAYATAERVAYLNLTNGYTPPLSGEYKNVYREWIGAQIRSDFYGYINPGKPEEAAGMAWRDARISHVKNGIYGSMWVAAMLATAYTTNDFLKIVEGGLGEIPQTSRLYAAVENIIDMYKKGVSAEDCIADIRKRWDEFDPYDWCHTISNAEIVTASLLYGNGDYEKSICMAVGAAFDTDCNGATVGSVVGVANGYNALPHKWTDRIHDTLQTHLIGYPTVSIKEMAKKSMAFME